MAIRPRVLVFGNPLVPRDALPLELSEDLAKRLPEVEFVEFDPTEALEEEGRNLAILDTVEGILKCEVFQGMEGFSSGRLFSLHDFDLAATLKLLKKAGYLDSVLVFGVPMGYEKEKALAELIPLLRSNLF